jgi:hypothetical protein
MFHYQYELITSVTCSSNQVSRESKISRGAFSIDGSHKSFGEFIRISLSSSQNSVISIGSSLSPENIALILSSTYYIAV